MFDDQPDNLRVTFQSALQESVPDIALVNGVDICVSADLACYAKIFARAVGMRVKRTEVLERYR